MESRRDAIVIGGGPAGAVAALLLARRGWRVTLVEKGRVNRPKTCGHCLNTRAIDLLAHIGLRDDVMNLACGATDEIRVRDARGGVLRAPLSHGWLMDRGVFDQFLRDRAAVDGVELLQPAAARIMGTNAGESEVRVTLEDCVVSLHAPLVIGADGVGSMVARLMGFARAARIGRKFGFAFDVDACGDSSWEVMAAKAIHMFISNDGYVGVVRQDDGRGGVLHVAGLIAGGREAAPGADRDPFAFVRRCASLHPSLREIGMDLAERSGVKAFVASGPMPWQLRRIADGRFALIGDAAGYIEPFTGEGMSWAIESAIVLAESVANVRPGAWNDAAAAHYSMQWNHRVGTRQKWCGGLAMALERPVIVRTLVRAGALLPRMTQRLAQRVGAS